MRLRAVSCLTLLLLFLEAVVPVAVVPFVDQVKERRKIERFLGADGVCYAELRESESSIRQLMDNIELQGHWVSDHCEIWPGPKFVLREYQFYQPGNFLLRQYEYEDDSCTKPRLGFSAHGYMVHMGRSWAVSSSFDASFTIHRVSVIPYTKTAAIQLTNSLRKECRFIDSKNEIHWPVLTEYKDYLLYYKDDGKESAVESANGMQTAEIDCLHAANISLDTLKLLRMENVRDKSSGSAFFTKRLYFGLPIWNAANRSFLSPSSFLKPLYNLDQVPECKACERVGNSNPLHPPRIRGQKSVTYPIKGTLGGYWLSTCESYMFGLFVRRVHAFDESSSQWFLRQSYFNDPLCKHPSYVVTAGGRYSLDGTEPHLQASRILYNIESVNVSVESKAMLMKLRKARNCVPSHKWRLSRAVDVGMYGGCPFLGLQVPAVTHDVLKIVGDAQANSRPVLYTGDYSSVEFSGDAFPTSFHGPLTQCESVEVVVSLLTPIDKTVDRVDGVRGVWWSKVTSVTLFSFIVVLCALIVVICWSYCCH